MGKVKQEDYWPALAEAEAKAKEQKTSNTKNFVSGQVSNNKK